MRRTSRAIDRVDAARSRRWASSPASDDQGVDQLVGDRRGRARTRCDRSARRVDAPRTASATWRPGCAESRAARRSRCWAGPRPPATDDPRAQRPAPARVPSSRGFDGNGNIRWHNQQVPRCHGFDDTTRVSRPDSEARPVSGRASAMTSEREKQAGEGEVVRGCHPSRTGGGPFCARPPHLRRGRGIPSRYGLRRVMVAGQIALLPAAVVDYARSGHRAALSINIDTSIGAFVGAAFVAPRSDPVATRPPRAE